MDGARGMMTSLPVIPAQAGIQPFRSGDGIARAPGPRLRRGDGSGT